MGSSVYPLGDNMKKKKYLIIAVLSAILISLIGIIWSDRDGTLSSSDVMIFIIGSIGAISMLFTGRKNKSK